MKNKKKCKNNYFLYVKTSINNFFLDVNCIIFCIDIHYLYWYNFLSKHI